MGVNTQRIMTGGKYANTEQLSLTENIQADTEEL
jgi:hypothetical protein